MIAYLSLPFNDAWQSVFFPSIFTLIPCCLIILYFFLSLVFLDFFPCLHFPSTETIVFLSTRSQESAHIVYVLSYCYHLTWLFAPPFSKHLPFLICLLEHYTQTLSSLLLSLFSCSLFLPKSQSVRTHRAHSLCICLSVLTKKSHPVSSLNTSIHWRHTTL